MSLKEPTSMEECIYFTKRPINSGYVKAWVFRQPCPKCGKSLIGKPKDEKTGKVKIRAKIYTCPECNHTVEKQSYEDTLTCNIKYTCPFCHFQGEIQIPFKRKKISRLDKLGKRKTVEALQFKCKKCDKEINVTKKMK